MRLRESHEENCQNGKEQKAKGNLITSPANQHFLGFIDFFLNARMFISVVLWLSDALCCAAESNGCECNLQVYRIDNFLMCTRTANIWQCSCSCSYISPLFYGYGWLMDSPEWICNKRIEAADRFLLLLPWLRSVQRVLLHFLLKFTSSRSRFIELLSFITSSKVGLFGQICGV